MCEGAPAGSNRSDCFHTVIGHYLGCSWDVEQICEHLQQFPDGIGGRYLAEGRLSREISRSAGKYNARALPLFDGWTAKAPQQPVKEEDPELEPEPAPVDPGLLEIILPEPASNPELKDNPSEPTPDDPELEDVEDDFENDEELDEAPWQDPKLPPVHAHGDPDSRPLKVWLIKRLIPAVGHGLLSGQWGAGKTFVAFDLAASLGTGQPFLGHPVKRQCGVLLIAAEGADEVRLRLDAVIRTKCGGMQRAPFRWYEDAAERLGRDADCDGAAGRRFPAAGIWAATRAYHHRYGGRLCRLCQGGRRE